MKEKNLPHDINSKSLTELREMASNIIKKLESEKDLESLMEEYQKLIKLNNIIENTNFKNKKLNLLSIDIENYEYQVLSSFNFNKYKPDVVVVEIHNIKQKDLEIYTQSLDFILKSKIYKLMLKNNYKLVNWIQSDFVFVRKNLRIK